MSADAERQPLFIVATSATVAADVDAGKALFAAGQGNCVGCHSGAKWTISKRFYTPGDIPNAATASVTPTIRTWRPLGRAPPARAAASTRRHCSECSSARRSSTRNARTLEEVFAARFAGHFQSPIAQVFSPTASDVQKLVAYMLSIDESIPSVAIPAVGATGGSICHDP